MNHFFSFHNKKFYGKPPQQKITSINKNIVIKRNSFKPTHSFRQGLITRLANPAGCGCGK